MYTRNLVHRVLSLSSRQTVLHDTAETALAVMLMICLRDEALPGWLSGNGRVADRCEAHIGNASSFD